MRLGFGFSISRRSFPLGSVAELLLDLYPGAAGAYSLRKIRGAYSGSAIRVRESSGNTEADIGFDSNGDLDTTALLAHTGSNDGLVVTWYDQSGNGNDATQATSTEQPRIVSAGAVLLQNGTPIIDFDGVDDFLDTVFATSIVQPGTIFTASTSTNVNSDLHFFIASRISGARWQLWVSSNSAEPKIFSGAVLSSGINLTDDQQFLASIVFNGVNSKLNIDGTQVATGDAGTNNLDGFSIGQDPNGNSGNQMSQEVIIYPSDQSSNRADIETNINNYYGAF